MGECSKIWNDPKFVENAGRVSNEVRLWSLKLTAKDVAHIFYIFRHVKSIWFYNCELDIPPSDLPIKDDYYQIEMISLID